MKRFFLGEFMEDCTLCQRYQILVFSILLTIPNAILYRHYGGRYAQDAVIATGVAATFLVSVLVMLYGTLIWRWRNSGLLLALLGIVLYLGWLGLVIAGWLDSFDGWELAITRALLTVGGFLFALGLLGWVQKERNGDNDNEYDTGHAAGVADEKYDQSERERLDA